jgi:hypothetical protein
MSGPDPVPGAYATRAPSVIDQRRSGKACSTHAGATDECLSMSFTVGVQMSAKDRAELTRWTRPPSLRAGLAQRARIVLLAAEGVGTNEIVQWVGVSKPTVIGWKKRYAAEGIGGLGDRPQAGSRAGGRRGCGGAGHAGAARQAQGDALVEPAAGRAHRRDLVNSGVTRLQLRKVET